MRFRLRGTCVPPSCLALLLVLAACGGGGTPAAAPEASASWHWKSADRRPPPARP